MSQDEEGFFNIRLHATGPDQFVLDKAIAQWAALFEGRATGFRDARANVPAFDPFDLPYPVAETIIEEAMAWVQYLWNRAVFTHLPCRVELFADDGWTDKPSGPIILAASPSDRTA